jgi:hypothetical protein
MLLEIVKYRSLVQFDQPTYKPSSLIFLSETSWSCSHSDIASCYPFWHCKLFIACSDIASCLLHARRCSAPCMVQTYIMLVCTSLVQFPFYILDLLDSSLTYNSIFMRYFIQDGYPLQLACKNGHAQVAGCLLAHGAPVNQKDKVGHAAWLVSSTTSVLFASIFLSRLPKQATSHTRILGICNAP